MATPGLEKVCFLILLVGSVTGFTGFTGLTQGRSFFCRQSCMAATKTSSSDGSMAAPASSLKFVNGIRDVADNHDIFLLDMWGVMHDGSNPYEGVLETVQKLKEAGKEMVILSNSSKRKENSIKMLKKLGFEPSDFSQIITSGDIAYRMLAGDTTLECSSWPVLSEIKDKKVFVFGSGNQDVEYCVSSGWELAPIEEAELVLARGTFTICNGQTTIEKNEGEDEYFRVLDKSLDTAVQRNIPMLVSNPDKVRPDEGFPPMPGSIADAYESKLRATGASEEMPLVKRIGKPFPEVYELVLRGRDSSKACMVGDALETDVTGGSLFGITTVWVTNDGIHGPVVKDAGSLEEGANNALMDFNQKELTYAKGRQLLPSIVIPHFQWQQ